MSDALSLSRPDRVGTACTVTPPPTLTIVNTSTPLLYSAGGLVARKFDPETAVGQWDGKEFPNGGMVHGREYTEEELWDHYTYFIKKLAPVAEAAGVYIGIHPDDPPFYSLGGVPRCIFGTFEGYKRAMEIADSPNSETAQP